MDQFKNIEIPIQNKMDRETAIKWENGEFLKNHIGYYNYGKWRIYIYNHKNNYTTIKVDGYDGICFGEFRLSYNYDINYVYYPTIKFCNRFSLTNSESLVNIKLISFVEFNEDNITILTLESLIKAVDESWDKIKNFLNK